MEHLGIFRGSLGDIWGMLGGGLVGVWGRLLGHLGELWDLSEHQVVDPKEGEGLKLHQDLAVGDRGRHLVAEEDPHLRVGQKRELA